MLSHLKKTPYNKEGIYCIEFDLSKFDANDKKCGIATNLWQRINSYQYPHGINIHGYIECNDSILLKTLEDNLCIALQNRSCHSNFKSNTCEWFNLSTCQTNNICDSIAKSFNLQYETLIFKDDLKNIGGIYIISPKLRISKYRKIGCAKRVYKRLNNGYTTTYPYGFKIRCILILNTSSFYYMFERELKKQIKCFGHSEYTNLSYNKIRTIFRNLTKQYEMQYQNIYKNGKRMILHENL